MVGDRFEWDEGKRSTNIAKHGIDFQDIPPAFDRPCIEDFDWRHSTTGETRWKVLGLVKGQVVFFVYAERGGTMRVITARPATKKETMVYYRRFWFHPWT